MHFERLTDPDLWWFLAKAAAIVYIVVYVAASRRRRNKEIRDQERARLDQARDWPRRTWTAKDDAHGTEL